jgi:hypothetical protein
MDPLIESIAVNIPTNAMMPKAIINTVSVVLSKLERIELNAILRFSLKRLFEYIREIIRSKLIQVLNVSNKIVLLYIQIIDLDV